MRVMVFVFVGLVFALSLAAQGADGIFPFNYRLVQLDNGFKAYLVQAGAPNQITYLSVVRTGSRDEWEEGKSGFAHFFEHIMFQGTEKYPVYETVVSEMGAAYNANTSNDRTVYYLDAPSEYLEQIIDLKSDRFMNLKYSEADFRTEAGAILGEYQQSAREPFRFLNEKIRETAYDEHTYRHTTIGFEADVRAMPEAYDYSLSFYDRYYRPENVVLLLVGDFDLDEAESLIGKYYSGWEAGYVPPQVTPEPIHTASRRRTLEYPGRTLPILSVNFQGPAWSAEDKFAVAAQVLGQVAFGENSEINRKLVIEERKVQFLHGDFGLARDPALVDITTMIVNPDEVGLIESEIQGTINHFKSELIDEKIFNDIKSNMKYGFLMGLETAQNTAFALLPYVINTGGIEAVEEYYRTLDTVTREDVREAARDYLVEDRKTVVVMVQKEGGK